MEGKKVIPFGKKEKKKKPDALVPDMSHTCLWALGIKRRLSMSCAACVMSDNLLRLSVFVCVPL